MKKILPNLILIGMALLSGFSASAYYNENAYRQEVYDNLSKMEIPLVVINTVYWEEPTCDVVSPPEGAIGSGIINATKVPSDMQIILKGDTLYDSGEYVKKESGLTVKIRGNTSGRKAKKSYKLKLQKKADLLFRGDKKFKDKDWVLLRTGATLAPSIGYWTSELIGQEWTPAHKIVNLWMNGYYRGIYILCEQVTVNSDSRIQVDEKEGYVVEADPYWWTEDIYFASSLTAPELKFTYKYPDPEDLTDEWHEAVSSDVLAHEATIAEGTYDRYYDCESFAKWLIGWDLLGNGDTAGANMYIVKKDGSSKITMGPMWDFDEAFYLLEEWIPIHSVMFYYHHMLNSPNDSFRNAFKLLWKERGRQVAESLIERINAFADSSVANDYQRSLDLQDECDVPYDFWQPYVGNVEYMREFTTDFIAKRADWINAHIDEVSGVDVIGIDGTHNGSFRAFDILGRPVTLDTPGLKIIDGRKVIVKP